MKPRFLALLGLITLVSFSAFTDDGEITAREAFCKPAMATEDCVEAINVKMEIINLIQYSPFVSSKLEVMPFNVRFKAIDVNEGDSVLGVEFGYHHELSRNIYSDYKDRIKSYAFDFDIKGTATQEEEKNPRNFIVAKLSFSLSSSPTYGMEDVSTSYDRWLALDERTKTCRQPQYLTDSDCIAHLKKKHDEQFKAIGLTYYFDYGIDLGYETDQSFDANNKTISAFFAGTLQDLSNNTFLGAANIIPSIRIGIDTVDPSAETPRVMAGDDSSYERLSAEFNVSVPLTKLLNTPLLFSFGYRSYEELSASEIIKNADLDSYRLRTYVLSIPTGLFISYSSGRLPFGFLDQQVVELGYQTHF